MRKAFVLFICLVLCTTLFAACGKDVAEETTTTVLTTTATTTTEVKTTTFQWKDGQMEFLWPGDVVVRLLGRKVTDKSVTLYFDVPSGEFLRGVENFTCVLIHALYGFEARIYPSSYTPGSLVLQDPENAFSSGLNPKGFGIVFEYGDASSDVAYGTLAIGLYRYSISQVKEYTGS